MIRDGRPRCLTLVATLILVFLAAGCATPTAVSPGSAASEAPDRGEDRAIRSAILGRIVNDDELLHDANITVTVFDGVVLLSGEVSRAEPGQRIASFAREETDARRVHNELVIEPLSSVFARARDRGLRTSARTRVRRLDEPASLDPGRVHITADRGRIYLMGRVTQEEAEAITDVVRRISGVRQVVRLFDYLEES